MRLNIEDMKRIANMAIAVADDISVEADSLRVFCHKVISAMESAEDDFKVVTLDGEKAKVTYLRLKARLIELVESIPTKVSESESEVP